MDVEGHDVHALRGLSRFLERRELALICEVSRDNQSRVGSTPEELFRMMKDHGFGVFQFDIVQSRWRRSVRLTALEAPLEIDPYEVLFIRTGSILWNRLQEVRYVTWLRLSLVLATRRKDKGELKLAPARIPSPLVGEGGPEGRMRGGVRLSVRPWRINRYVKMLRRANFAGAEA